MSSKKTREILIELSCFFWCEQEHYSFLYSVIQEPLGGQDHYSLSFSVTQDPQEWQITLRVQFSGHSK